MRYLLDTNVISELVSKKPDRRVLDWLDSLDAEAIYLSALTIGEICRGIERLEPSPRRESLGAWLRGDLLIRFEGRIVPVDTPVVLRWGTLAAELGKIGRPLPAIDSLIAASALHHGLLLVTRNDSDFAPTGLSILNPWKEARGG